MHFQDIFKKLGIEIADDKNRYFEFAVTHPSYNADANTKHHDYERLEYMGDAVIDFVSADLIFRLHPDMNEGDMSKLRSYLVKSESLAKYAREINLHEDIRTGHSIDKNKIYSSSKILEDVFEAIVGAVYLDQGIEKAYQYVEFFLKEAILNYDPDSLVDPKTKLQEEMQSEHRDSVHYVTIEASGPAHDRVFKVNVMFNDIVLATGTGKSKKAAEEDAARNALAKRSV